MYLANLDVNGPGYFQTYTFDHDRQSMVRFLNNANGVQEGDIGGAKSVFDQLATEASGFLNFNRKQFTPENDESNTGDTNDKDEYLAPDTRACGRPNNVGWLDLLGDEEVTGVKPEDKDASFDSDNWREVIQNKQATR